MTASHLNLGVIGNCQIGSLIDEYGKHVWTCLPRFDGDPMFCALLRDDPEEARQGFFLIELEGCVQTSQRYLRNTAILETELATAEGARLRILDFSPRFRLFGRNFHPAMLIRIVEPIAGQPVIRVRLRPLTAFGERVPASRLGSSHIRYEGSAMTLRVTTDASLTAVTEERALVLRERITFILGPDESIAESVDSLAQRFLVETERYWVDWARSLAIPFEWQEAVIRAAITLKLCSFEDTGAVIAAMTTSIPEAAGSGRNWDYRHCWLRDSYFTIQALNGLGATRTMEAYLRYIANVVAGAEATRLQPVYGISGQAAIVESIITTLPGYRGMGPVRIGNQAYEQHQHDVYGAVILAATQAFFDLRLTQRGDAAAFAQLEAAGERCVALFDQPDAGLWEYRGRARVHTFSSVMCWAGADRLARIAAQLDLKDRAAYWRRHADAMHARICSEAWDPAQDSFTESWGLPALDASLLLLHELGFLAADDPRFRSTIAAIERVLRRGDYLMRYVGEDDFGLPENAFNICTFWFVNALAVTGRKEEARRIFENMLARRNPLGLLSEDLDPVTGELWGNYPQTYSLVGIIGAAIRLSRSWEEAL
jgi:GH15 family glucan-1,4-alpha-glucosidase